MRVEENNEMAPPSIPCIQPMNKTRTYILDFGINLLAVWLSPLDFAISQCVNSRPCLPCNADSRLSHKEVIHGETYADASPIREALPVAMPLAGCSLLQLK